jgi:heme exporter protein B
MTQAIRFTTKLFWLVHKDLVREYRARMTWPAVLLMGLVVVLTLELQLDLPAALKQPVAGGMLWLAIFFAGTLAVERSFTNERDEGCWDALRMYPLSPATIYLAKVLFNLITLSCVTCILVPVFVVLSDAPLLDRPGPMVLVTMLANLGFAAVGTLISALTNALRQRGNLLVLLLLPLVLPAVLGASAATRLVIAGDLGFEFWRWVQLLAAFAVTFITVGVLVFDFVMEG